MGGGLEICANQAFGRAGFFDFGNDGRLVLRMLAAQCGNEIAHGRGLLRQLLHVRQIDGGFLRGDFFALGGKDFPKDVGHGGLSKCAGCFLNSRKQPAPNKNNKLLDTETFQILYALAC